MKTLHIKPDDWRISFFSFVVVAAMATLGEFYPWLKFYFYIFVGFLVVLGMGLTIYSVVKSRRIRRERLK